MSVLRPVVVNSVGWLILICPVALASPVTESVHWPLWPVVLASPVSRFGSLASLSGCVGNRDQSCF